MSEYLNALNAVQRAAVTTTDGPVLVVAGPGSGKTRVLTFRIAYLIEQGVAPWEILALTFTNKAAREMKDRIEKVVGSAAQKVWAGTFHAIFARILRGEATHIGYPSDFTIYDTEDSKSLLRTIIKEKNLSRETYNENAILGRISSAKSNLISPQAYAANDEFRAQDKATKRPFIADIYKEYAVRCKRAGAMDFDDLLFQLYVLLHTQPDIATKYRQRFRYILVDEFQDTNFLQASIIKKLVVYPNSPQNICVVGDDAQSIYAFRGATIENILDFERDFAQLKTFKLEQNYRSTQPIVAAANTLIQYNRRQIQKNIWTEKTEGQRLKVLKTQSDQEEAKRVADLILEQKHRYHLRSKDIAILYRTNAQSRPFEEALRRQNLAYRVYGGTSFYARKEVKDALSYLRLVVNQNDDEALRRCINYPRRGIGDATVDKISQLAASKGQTMWQSLLEYDGTARERNALTTFSAMMRAFIDRAKTANAYEIAAYIMRQSGLLDVLRQDTTLEGLGRLQNVQSLLDAISEFVDNDEVSDDVIMPDKTLTTYLQNIALITDADNSDPNADVITLMSVHAAKGLEFKSVIVGGLEEDLFPSFMSRETPEGLDEERRLFYVAITRAEQHLTLTYAASRYKHGQMKYSEPSRFLEEIPQSVVEYIGSSGPSRTTMGEPRARVSGPMLGKPATKMPDVSQIDPSQFVPSPPSALKAGQTILHLRFGEGEIKHIDGAKDNPVAEIYFKDLKESKKIALKFAKLQIKE